MILDSSDRTWIWTAVGGSIVGGLLYMPYAMGSTVRLSGGSWPGIIYAIVGTSLMAFAGLLGMRKKYPTMRVGRVHAWMRGHVWLGLLSVPMILFHSGFAMGGSMTSFLVVAFALVIVSGIVGVMLQQFVPRLMMEQLTNEVPYERADEFLHQLLEKADQRLQSLKPKTAASTESTVAVDDHLAVVNAFYLNEVKPFLAGTRTKGLLSTKQRTEAVFNHVRLLVPPPVQPVLKDLEAFVEQRRDLTRQLRLHRLLHGWLLLHVPLSAVLFVLIVVHAVMALRYA
jgi:hypothetical protein